MICRIYRISDYFDGGGATGQTGPTGPTGPVGPVGPTGATGAAGTGQNLQQVTTVGNQTNQDIRLNTAANAQAILLRGTTREVFVFASGTVFTRIDGSTFEFNQLSGILRHTAAAGLTSTHTVEWRALSGTGALLSDVTPGPTGPTGPTGATGAAGSLAIGDAVAGSNADQLLYVDSGNLLAQSANAAFDGTTTGLLHLTGVSNTPTITIGAGGDGAGGGTGSVNGTDLSGNFIVNTGTLPVANAVIAVITFANPYNVPPKCVMVTPGSATAADIVTLTTMPYVKRTSINTTTFTLFSGATGALVGGSIYSFFYHVIE